MKRIGLIIILSGLIQSLIAQVTVSPFVFNQFDVHPDVLLKGIVTSDGEYIVNARAELRLNNGELILSVSSDPFQLTRGMNSLDRLIRLNQIIYGSSLRANNLKTYKQLDTGEFEFCIYIQSSEGLEIAAETCIPIIIDELLFLDLLSPLHEDSIETLRPALSWSVSGMNRSLGNHQYRITLKPLFNGQTLLQAFSENQAIFSMDKIMSFVVPFPFSVAPLEYGKSYCWGVELIRDGVVQLQSEIWKFSVKPPLIEKELKYVALRKGYSNDIYDAPNNRVYFTFSDGYITSNILIKLIKDDGTEIEKFISSDHMQSNEGSIVRSEGLNLFMIDFQELNLESGLYTLYVFNDKNDEFKLIVKLSK